MSGPKYFATRGHLLLCQGASCQRVGADLLYQGLKQHLERGQLAYYKAGGSVRLTTSGCLGACNYGPTLCVYRQTAQGAEQAHLEQAWYAAVNFPLARQVAQAVHTGEPLPLEHRYDVPDDPALTP